MNSKRLVITITSCAMGILLTIVPTEGSSLNVYIENRIQYESDCPSKDDNESISLQKYEDDSKSDKKEIYPNTEDYLAVELSYDDLKLYVYVTDAVISFEQQASETHEEEALKINVEFKPNNN